MVLVRAQEHASERIVEEVPLAPLIAAAIDRARPVAMPRGTTVSSRDLDDLLLYGDARLYARVFDNLIANAIHYNRDRGSVLVSARTVEAPSDQWTSDRVVVSVTDTGLGIPPDQWTRVFERFRRVESSRHRRRGAGLGLAICREIVTLYGGEIRVARSSSEGTTFEVDLPGCRAGGSTQAKAGLGAAVKVVN
jgi:signal transduction histidine kinase